MEIQFEATKFSVCFFFGSIQSLIQFHVSVAIIWNNVERSDQSALHLKLHIQRENLIEQKSTNSKKNEWPQVLRKFDTQIQFFCCSVASVRFQ